VTFLSVVVPLLAGCTTIRWNDPQNPDQPIFEYSSGKDIAATGILVEVDYYEDGSVKNIHVELGDATGNASKVVEQYNGIVEAAVKGAIEGLKIGHGVP
jgi:hypothetical protein